MSGKGKLGDGGSMFDDNIDKPCRTRKDDASWDLRTIGTFLELMHSQFKKGQFLSSTFSDQIYKGIAAEMFVKHRKEYTVTQLKGKACRLRVLWRKFHDLITKKTGFGWDPLTCTVTAPEDYWSSWIAENPNEASLRKKGLPHYDLCTEMFSNSVATGSISRSSTMAPLDSDDEDALNTTSSAGPSRVPRTNYGSPSFSNLGSPSNLNNIESPKINDKKQSKSNRSSRIDQALDAWTSVNSARASKMIKQSSSSIEECMAACTNMEDLPLPLFFLAQNEFLNKVRRKMFLLMTNEQKRAWVESLGPK
ncbi:hypothetical protein ACP275_09G021400 [Erythranthe tilingii]